MRILRTVDQMRSALSGRVALVPTMGAFHEGHVTLMREARKSCDTLVCSLFVNPKQFGPTEDFSRYPRDEARDSAIAEDAGVDILFAPSVDEVYGGNTTGVVVEGVSERWEGEVRPSHFDGVATVVCKLFNMVGPAVAYFGKKDLQQCAVIKRMVRDLNMPIELKLCETVREADGLAMSSRNAYLSSEDRARASRIFRELTRCASALKAEATTEGTSRVLAAGKASLAQEGFAVDYFALVDTETMEPRATAEAGDSVITAARLGTTRLIDNVQLVY